MKTSRLCALMAVLIGIAVFCGGAFAEDSAPGITILQVTGGGYLANGYKCGIAVVKKDSGKVGGTLQCISVASRGKKQAPPQKLVIDCTPVDITASCPGATSATIICRGGKQIGVTSGDPGDPTNNGTVSATGWGGSNFLPTPVLHGIVKVECVP